jgi:hypothetical protein
MCLLIGLLGKLGFSPIERGRLNLPEAPAASGFDIFEKP